MDTMMKELHSHGKTIKDIEEVLHKIALHPRVIAAIEAAHALGILSLIETILKHLGIREYFSEINTNPGYVNEEGRLRILPYHDFNKASRGCSLCPPNMCKKRIRGSSILEMAVETIPKFRLKEKDFMMPRKIFPLWDLICKDPSLVKAEIHGWSDGEELEQVLLHLINKVSMEHNSPFITSDCKLQTRSVSVLEALQKVPQVRP
ncbi:hypothetical protein VNO80_23219 [Phaseolus coccineus]|uniref:Uncharacterized protein n=1 Tax=Phaseolus coccineus TaxID=3886 RepID=A0AAN9QV10_PHACN